MVKKHTFEEALERLETIAKRLENGDVTLDDSLKIFEEGMKLIDFCNSRLNDAQKKIEKLTKSAEGSFQTEEFEPNSNTE
jgi:exodeoxyribonuclease VII small subunit